MVDTKRILRTGVFLGIELLFFIIININSNRYFHSRAFWQHFYSLFNFTISFGKYLVFGAIVFLSVRYCMKKAKAEIFLLAANILGILYLMAAHLSFSSYMTTQVKVIWYLIPLWCIIMAVHSYFLIKEDILKK